MRYLAIAVMLGVLVLIVACLGWGGSRPKPRQRRGDAPASATDERLLNNAGGFAGQHHAGDGGSAGAAPD